MISREDKEKKKLEEKRVVLVDGNLQRKNQSAVHIILIILINKVVFRMKIVIKKIVKVIILKKEIMKILKKINNKYKSKIIIIMIMNLKKLIMKIL